jgi:LysM repeat protein
MDGWLRLLLATALAASLAGCKAGPSAPSATSTSTLRPFRIAMATSRLGTATSTIAPLATVGPSPTPRWYVVRPNDSFLAIALAFGLSREELLAANPELNPDLLSIGQQLLIPAPGGEATATPIPTPTPLPLDVAEPLCFPSASGGLWCLLSVTNTTGESVEGLSGWVTLVDAGGTALVTAPVYPPLNLLPADKSMVLSAYLPPPAPGYSRAAGALTMAVPVQEAEKRYPPLDWSVTNNQPAADRRSWEVDVRVGMPASTSGSPRVAVAVLAFDARGQGIGFTKWEPDAALRPGEGTLAHLVVYSLGPQIERVDVLAEALAVP